MYRFRIIHGVGSCGLVEVRGPAVVTCGLSVCRLAGWFFFCSSLSGDRVLCRCDLFCCAGGITGLRLSNILFACFLQLSKRVVCMVRLGRGHPFVCSSSVGVTYDFHDKPRS